LQRLQPLLLLSAFRLSLFVVPNKRTPIEKVARIRLGLGNTIRVLQRSWESVADPSSEAVFGDS
jgi:hypothetical protein